MSRHAITADRVATSGVADTVVVEDGRVAAVVRGSEVGDDISRDHYPGGTIIPAFTDSHIHPVGYAALVHGTSLKGASGVTELGDRLRAAAGGTGVGSALVAQRLDDSQLGRLPTRHDLDAAVSDRPVLAYRYCGHIAVANTTALALAGVDSSTPDPVGGNLDRDRDGFPTGVLRETAIELVGRALEPLVDPPSGAEILTALEGLLATGITHIGGMVATNRPLWCGVGDELGALCALASDLPLDVDVMVIADSPSDLEAAAERIRSTRGRLRFWGWKYFADGSLGGHTAHMWGPFADAPTAGTDRLIGFHALEMCRAALALGGVAAIHAIGDRAVDDTLDLFDILLAEGVEPQRLRLEHASVASDRAIQRLAETGVVASIQPSFLQSEAGWVPARLGPHRSAYRFATMARSGVDLIGGSDSPVERPDPLAGIAAAVHRRGWDDAEHLTADQALALYTDSPARHFGKAPPLSPGAPADLLVIHGLPGEEDASVATVYLKGNQRALHPVTWPG